MPILVTPNTACYAYYTQYNGDSDQWSMSQVVYCQKIGNIAYDLAVLGFTRTNFFTIFESGNVERYYLAFVDSWSMARDMATVTDRLIRCGGADFVRSVAYKQHFKIEQAARMAGWQPKAGPVKRL